MGRKPKNISQYPLPPRALPHIDGFALILERAAKWEKEHPNGTTDWEECERQIFGEVVSTPEQMAARTKAGHRKLRFRKADLSTLPIFGSEEALAVAAASRKSREEYTPGRANWAEIEEKVFGTTYDAIEIMQSEQGLRISEKEWADFKVKAKVAMDVYEMRTNAGMTQADLADLIGTKPSVISRLEDVEYRGYFLTILEKIGKALGYDMEIRWKKTAESRHKHRRKS